MFKYSIGIILVIFTLQILLVDAAILDEKSYYKSISQNLNIEKFNSALAELDIPNFNFSDGLYEFLTHRKNDDIVFGCLVSHSQQISDALNEGQGAAIQCLNFGRSKLQSMIKATESAASMSISLVYSLQQVIPSCAAQNDDSTKALQCINAKESQISNSLKEVGQIIRDQLLRGNVIIEDTKKCLLETVNTYEEDRKIISASIAQCIGNNQ